MIALRSYPLVLLVSALLVNRLNAAQVDLLDDFLFNIENALDCASCLAFLGPAQGLARLGDSALVSTLNRFCVDLGVHDPDVCEGTVATQGPILAHDLRSISARGRTATSLCNAFLGLCEPPPIIPYSVPFPKPSLAAMNASVDRSNPGSERKIFQVMHISDVHVDHKYTVGAEANCTKPICCRSTPENAQEDTAVFDPALAHGHYNCDSPAILASSMLASFEKVVENPKFVIFTGDVVERDVWAVDKERVVFDLNAFNAQLASILGVPFYGSMGNHDVAPANDFPRNTTLDAPSVDWSFKLQSDGWERWINSTGAEQLLHHSGSYSVNVSGVNLKIVSLNTVYWYKTNLWLYDSDDFQPDPNGLLEFLVQELQAAEDAGQKAWIIGHMPPGSYDMLYDQSNYYGQILQRYKSTIMGSFYGHSHRDQFEVGYSNYSQRSYETADNFAIIGPGLTPTSGNPAYKVYDVDADTLELMDVKVYITIEWELYYSARETYGPLVAPPLPAQHPLTPAFWHNLTAAFEADPAGAFAIYIEHLTRGVKVKPCTEDAQCVEREICGMRAMRSQDNCFKPSFGLPGVRNTTAVGEQQAAFSVGSVDNDELEEWKEEHPCESPGLEYILRQLAGKLVRQHLKPETIDYLSNMIQAAEKTSST